MKATREIPAPLAAKYARDRANAYVKAAGRYGNGKVTNPAARKLARHSGIQTGIESCHGR